MIPRYLRIIFWSLIACIVAMAIFLFYERQSARDRLSSLSDQTPIDAPYTVSEPITFDLANDSNGTITATERQVALPTETTARARALLEHLIAEYSQPGSPHPLPSGAAVADVFLLALPITGHEVDTGATARAGITPSTLPVRSTDPNALQPIGPGGELAVINLRGSFVNSHPSGVEVESLTLLSMIGTLHANLPQIEQVRFLVDGQPHETLAGHADLLRTYPSRDTTLRPTTPTSQ
ncbi:MAG: GerMN domain-containing protein [Acidobacteriaceae bacterium]